MNFALDVWIPWEEALVESRWFCRYSSGSYLSRYVPDHLGFAASSWLQLALTTEGVQAHVDRMIDLPSVIEAELFGVARWLIFWLVRCEHIDTTGPRSPSEVAAAIRANCDTATRQVGFAFWSHQPVGGYPAKFVRPGCDC